MLPAPQAEHVASQPPQATAEQARELTDRIKVAVEATWELIKQAYVTRAWTALGYTSWDDYCTREFGTSRIRLPREERQEVVASMREIGMSIRAISSATGASVGTVAGHLGSTVQNRTVERQQLVTGSNGKVYQPTQPQRSAPAGFGGGSAPSYSPSVGAGLSLNPRDQFLDWTDEELQIRDRLNDGETVVISQRDNHAHVLKWADARDRYVRVDRRTEWGNPFETPADGDRDRVIRNYAEHYLPHKPSLLAKLPDLRGKALGCWCAPLPCHADVLKQKAEQ